MEILINCVGRCAHNRLNYRRPERYDIQKKLQQQQNGDIEEHTLY